MSQQKEQLKVYCPKINRSGSKIWKDMYSDLWSSRELIWRLMVRDISVRYRQSMLGYVWAILPQIVTVALFTFLSRHRVFDMGTTSLPYVIHALWSMSVWQFFSGSLVVSTNSLVSAGTLVTKINFPKSALIFSGVGQVCVDFAVRLIPVSIVFIWFGFVPSWHIVFIPVFLACILLMALGIGFFLSILNLVFRDVSTAVGTVLTFCVFLAPIFYPPPEQAPLNMVNYLNPFSPLLIATQQMLSGQTLENTTSLSVVSGLSVFVFLFGWRMFHLTMPRIAERA